MLNYAKHKGYAHDIPIPKPVKKYEPRIRTFTKIEIEIILNNTQPNNFKKFVRFAYYTGARSGEIRCMDKKYIDRGMIKGKSGYMTLKISKQPKEAININNQCSYTK